MFPEAANFFRPKTVTIYCHTCQQNCDKTVVDVS